uniref:Uncharacterized protein n=1 Tax=Opuntia streptacantha TaxID=393608 RepID=A0A7C9EK61_OPUST
MKLSSWQFWAMVHIHFLFLHMLEQLLLTEDRILRQCPFSTAHSTHPRCYTLRSCSSSSSLRRLNLCKSSSKIIRIQASLLPPPPPRSTCSRISSRDLKEVPPPLGLGAQIQAGRIFRLRKAGPIMILAGRIARRLQIVARGQT